MLLRFVLSYVHALLTCISGSTVSLTNWHGCWPCRWKSQLLKSRSSDCVIWCTCSRKRPYVYTQFLKNQFPSLNWYPPTEELLLRLCYLVHKYQKQMAIFTCIPSSSENPGLPSLTDLVIRHAGGGIPTTEELLLRSCHPVHTYQKMATLIYTQFLPLTDLVGRHASGNVTTDKPLSRLWYLVHIWILKNWPYSHGYSLSITHWLTWWFGHAGGDPTIKEPLLRLCYLVHMHPQLAILTCTPKFITGRVVGYTGGNPTTQEPLLRLCYLVLAHQKMATLTENPSSPPPTDLNFH